VVRRSTFNALRHLYQAITLRLCTQNIFVAGPETLAPTFFPPHPATSLAFPHTEPTPLPNTQLSSLLVIWLTSLGPFVFKRFSSLPWGPMRKRRASEHPLATQFQSCDSTEDITTILQRQTQAFINLQGSDRIFKSIKTTVSILTALSSAASLADAFSLVRQKLLTQCSTSLTGFVLQTFPPAKAVQACLAILLDVCPSPRSYKDILSTSR